MTRRTLSAVLLSLCWSPLLAAPADPAGGTGGDPLAGSLTVTVIAADTGAPLPGAWVMAGPAEGVPFTGNVGTTDGAGVVTFGDPALTGSITITAGDVGHAYLSVIDLPTSEVVLPLAPLAEPVTASIGDAFDGIEVNNGFACFGDGNLDFGLVLPAIALDNALGGGIPLAISSETVPLSTPFGDFDVPLNVAIPTQCELFTTFAKPGYGLDVPLGRTTAFGLTARVPTGALLDSASLVDLVRASSFRELDVIRDVQIVADRTDVDLTAATPVNADLTLNISNAAAGRSVFAVAGGRLTANDGSEELVVSGVDAFDPDVDGPSATLSIETVAAAGTLADLVPGAIVIQLGDAADDAGAFTTPTGSASTTALVRDGFTPPATLTFDSFFEFPEIDSADDTTFSWTDVRSATSPAVRHANSAGLSYRQRLPDPSDPGQTITTTTGYWTLWSVGDAASLTLPALPASAPVVLPDPDANPGQDRFDLTLAVSYLGDAASFDFGGFAFRDLGRFGTHVSTGARPLRCDTVTEVGALLVEPGAGAGEVRLSWSPSGDLCHNTLTARGYEVFAASSPRPTVEPGAFPDDPAFVRVTDEDSDGSSADTTFTHVPPAASTYYLVVDRGSSGNDGPSGHY